MSLFRKAVKFFFIGLGVFCVYYVGTHLEFEDPFQEPSILKGNSMSEAERKSDPLLAASMTSEAATALYEAFGSLTKILDAQDIDYWIGCGTLLGAVRHEGVIPYDDDVDIFVHEKDGNRILKLKDDLKKIGLGIYQDRTSIKVYKLDGSPVRPKKWTFRLLPGVWLVRRKIEKFPFIDLYIAKIKDGEYIHANDRARRVFPKESFKEDDIYPLRDYQFGTLRVKGPQNPFNHLQKAYGQDWANFLVFTSNHSGKDPIKFTLPLTPQLAAYCFRYQG